MERRKNPRKDWVVTKDDLGRSVLQWKVDPMRARRMETDPSARTYDFLNRLTVPDLELVDDARTPRSSRSFNPYDRGANAPRRPKTLLDD